VSNIAAFKRSLLSACFVAWTYWIYSVH